MQMSTSKAKRSRRDGADGDGAKRVKVISPSSSFVHHEPPINQPLALEYLCPITRELPVDPVMAEDGRIYERSAIEKHFITCQSSNLGVDSSVTRSSNDQQGESDSVPSPRHTTSPMSGGKIGTNLYEAVQARNTIHFLISSNTISSELIENWKRNKDVHEAIKGASLGDTPAMMDLASWHYYGCRGLSKDIAKSMEWYKKAANSDNTTAMVALSKHFLLVKDGLHFNQASGIYYLTEAANKGDASAALLLGTSFLRGDNGVSKDIMLARKWLKHAAEGANDAPSGVAMLAKFLLARLSNTS